VPLEGLCGEMLLESLPGRPALSLIIMMTEISRLLVIDER